MKGGGSFASGNALAGNVSAPAPFSVARYLMVARPGRKKYAPPLTLMKLGIWSVRCRTDGGLSREAARFVARRADEPVLFAAEPAEDAVVDPVLLNEFELPLDVAIQADEEHSPFVAVCRRGSWRKQLAVGAASPQQPVPIGQVQRRRGIGCQRVTRVGPPDVRADRAGEAVRIVCERELVTAGAGGVGRDERHAVGTTPDQPRGEFLRVLRRGRVAGDGRDEISEFRHVLFQLTKDQVRAVAAKLTKVCSVAGTYRRQQGMAVESRVDRNSRIDRSIAGRVAQEELAQA